MTPDPFTNVLVPVDGSAGSTKALGCAVSLCAALQARLTALAVEGKLPAYPTSVSESNRVKQKKDEYFNAILQQATRVAVARGIAVTTDLVPGHAAEVISHYARAHGHDLIVTGIAATSSATTSSARPRTGLPTMPTARSWSSGDAPTAMDEVMFDRRDRCASPRKAHERTAECDR